MIHASEVQTICPSPFEFIAPQVQRQLKRVLGFPEDIFFFLIGLPGSGKTTFKTRFLEGFPFVSYDSMVIPLLKDRTDSEEYVRDLNLEIVNKMEHRLRHYLLAEQEVVVFEEASIGLSLYRAHFIQLAKLHGFKVILLHFPIDAKTAFARNQQRSLGMNEEGQIRVPEIIICTLTEHQNTHFRINPEEKSLVQSMRSQTDVKETVHLPYLVSRLSPEQQAVINQAFFKFPTLIPEDEALHRQLLSHDTFDEIWSILESGIRITI